MFNHVDWLITSNQYQQSYKGQDLQENDRKTEQHMYISNFSLFIIKQYKYFIAMHCYPPTPPWPWYLAPHDSSQNSWLWDKNFSQNIPLLAYKLQVFLSGRFSGEAQGTQAPPYFWTKLRPKGPKKFFKTTPPPYLRAKMEDEYHFLNICPAYQEKRCSLLDYLVKEYRINPPCRNAKKQKK